MPILQPENLIAKPFCFGAESGVDYQIPPYESPNPAIVTQAQGYPKQQAEPLDAGGEPVDRSQTNGIERIITENIAFATCGGLYTFNQIISDRNGGYQDGAVLYDYRTRQYVVSLKDNNTDNFVANPNYIDDVSWSYIGRGLGAFCGDLKYSMQKNNHIAGNGEWMIANGQAIPAKYTQAIAMFGTNLPNCAGRVLAMANPTHPSKSTAGADIMDVPLLEHNHTGTYIHLHGMSQTVHLHDPNGNQTGWFIVNYNSASRGPQYQGGGTGATADHTWGANANITIGPPSSGTMVIEKTGTPNAKMSVIQPTYYVENIFIYCC